MGWSIRAAVAASVLATVVGCAASRSDRRAAWTRACVRLSGCEPFVGLADPYAGCALATSNRPDVATAECVVAAATCEAAGACLGLEAADTCGDPPPCEGDVLQRCSRGLSVEDGGWRRILSGRDCAAEGLVCRVIYPTYASAGFRYGVCALPGTCEADFCDGDRRVLCNRADVNEPGVPVPFDCERGVCGDDGACTGEGDACEPGSWCEGDVAVTCLNGRLHRETCVEGTCSPEATGSLEVDGSRRCVAGDACEPRCEGTEVVRCVDGQIERYDCRDWGYESCFMVDRYPGTPVCG